MKARCTIEVEFPDRKSLSAAIAALSHEGDVGNRSSIRMKEKDKTLALEIEAKDVVALRAAANACLRALQVFENIEEVQKDEEGS
ncbi:MAG: KEOPS complex subunit Pcc1 [Candidatus ainarchaeum sp.]|nr:KEOPS complex subunit Pcc1 [Candidatus ainarchaeum sp.]